MDLSTGTDRDFRFDDRRYLLSEAHGGRVLVNLDGVLVQHVDLFASSSRDRFARDARRFGYDPEDVKSDLANLTSEVDTIATLDADQPRKRAVVIDEDPATDFANARRFADHTSGSVLYCHLWRKFLIWDGTRFRPDDRGKAAALAGDVVAEIYHEAAAARTADLRTKLAKWAVESQSEKRIKAMLSLVRSVQELTILPDDLDRDAWLFNVANGTIDLRTGEFGQHRRDDLITKLAPVEYRPKAEAPCFVEFLHRVLPSEGLFKFVQRAVGYSLTGETRERIMFLLYGTGANGKTTLLEVLLDLLGDYALSTPPQTLVGRAPSAIPNDLARLSGARLVTCRETEDAKSLAASTVKALTGRDTITARFMRGEWFDFRPTFKPWLATNYKPRVPAEDRALWDRLRLIPFDVRIPEEQQDKDLPRKLRDELPGILRWAVVGCQEWLREGLGTPLEVREATADYRDEMDHMKRFLEERCIVDGNAKAPAEKVRGTYVEWCETNGEKPLAATTMKRQLEAQGLEQRRSGATGSREWHGIGLLTADAY